MIRKAEIADVPFIIQLLRRFHEKSKLSVVAPFNFQTLYDLCNNLIDSENGALFVSDNGDIGGVIGGYVNPVFFNSDYLTGQEIFWWCEDGNGAALKSELENWALSKGAKTFTMMSLESLNPRAVGKIYERSGYSKLEHHYIKELQ